MHTYVYRYSRNVSFGNGRNNQGGSSSSYKRGGGIMGSTERARAAQKGSDKESDIDEILHRTSKRLREIQQVC
jgi:hypothetical protein